MDTISRGDVFFIVSSQNNTPTGSEFWADRYGIVVSNDVANKYSNVVNIVYLTTKKKTHLQPTQISISFENKKATALCEQIHAVDKSRLFSKKGTLSKKELHQIDLALLLSLNLTPANAIGIFKKWEHYIQKNKWSMTQKEDIFPEKDIILEKQQKQLSNTEKERDAYKTLFEIQKMSLSDIRNKMITFSNS